MSLSHILTFSALALCLGWALKQRGRSWVLLGGSLVALFWLQPFSPVRHLDFWLPFTSLALVTWTWVITRPVGSPLNRQALMTIAVLAGIELLISLTRYLGPICCLTASRPPGLFAVLVACLLALGIAWLLSRSTLSRAAWLSVGIALVLLLFIALKTEFLAKQFSAVLRTLNGQSPQLASALDLPWLGFSYIAFRLLHVLRDHQSGKPNELSLKEFLTYAFFFPSLSAGPIDRSQRFAQDLRRDFILSEPSLIQAGGRLVIGIFKKFVLADGLALIALNEANAVQSTSAPWLWVLVYAYALRIYFDFSGYTDIAIGLGLLFGIRLPENFDRPYLKSNLTAFWNSWHMTLAQWMRAYFFNPFTRFLRTRSRPIPMPLIVFCGQVATMLLIGLWHGMTWNFAIWGAWHGLGMFVHNRWSDSRRGKVSVFERTPGLKRLSHGLGTLATFHFVTLGWVWFALPAPEISWQVLLKLFGAGG